MIQVQELNKPNTNIIYQNKYLEEFGVKKHAMFDKVDNSPFRVTFQFPPASVEDDEVKKEVKQIMTSALLEQLCHGEN